MKAAVGRKCLIYFDFFPDKIRTTNRSPPGWKGGWGDRGGKDPNWEKESQPRCLPTIPASSNMFTCGLPNTASNLASALMARLLVGSCRPWALM